MGYGAWGIEYGVLDYLMPMVYSIRSSEYGKLCKGKLVEYDAI